MKVLITADIHLGDYSDYNYSAKSRLKQFDSLSKRLVELGKENNCDECWILGDFLRVPNSKSRIQHRLKEFVKELCKNFTNVRYILGQHDLDAKSNSIDIDDTVVSIPELPNFIYMDKVIMNFGNKTIAFANWTPSQDLTWITDKVDLLCGHYTKSDLFGQEIDDSKFDIMIHGDIHNHQVIGKFISVGNPIQHDYSSQPDGTCIVLDTDTLAWKHIEVDPDKTRFLRLYYTDEPAFEGFKGPLKYYKYMPAIQREMSDSDTGERTLKWDDIDDLVTQVIEHNELSDIHSEVISGLHEVNEIDFNIQLVSLDIKGYRSLVDFHIDFNSNDRIVLLGKNGSGKSSIISAIKSLFQDGRYLKYQQSDLCDGMSIRLIFKYQNKLVSLTKGDSYELVIDNEVQKYNNKRDFEADLIEKFPFISYLDIFFINPGSSNLSSQLSPARKVELINKFYRLDRITACEDKALQLYQSFQPEISELRTNIDKKSGSLDHINKRLSELSNVNVSRYQIVIDRLTELNKLRSDFENYRSWQLKFKPIESQKIEIENTIANYKQKLEINVASSERRLEALQIEVAAYDKDLLEQTNRWNRLKQLKVDLETCIESGTVIKSKVDKLQLGKCPECGANVKESEYKLLKAKYTKELEDMRSKYDQLSDELDKYTDSEKSENYFITYISKLKRLKTSSEDERLILSNKLNQYRIAKEDLTKAEARLAPVLDQYNELLSSKPYEVKLPINIDNEEESLRSELAKINELNQEAEAKLTVEQEITQLESDLIEKDKKAERYKTYAGLMSNSGEVMEEILKRLASKFSSNEIKYEINSGVYYGNRFIEFNSLYKVKATWRLYDTLSDGQKQVCDLDFLNKLFSVRVGLLVLDEYLRHLDDDNFPKCADLLMQMNVDTVLLSTHDPNLSVYTKRVLLELNDKGETESKIV